jgi:hypothetical protein
MYFPEKPSHANEEFHYDQHSNGFIPDREHSYDFK